MIMSMKEEKAIKLAEFIHCGQKRRDGEGPGEDFVNHPKRVAKAIKELGYDEDVFCAACLHDSEDFPYLNVLLSLIDRTFGSKVFGLVLVLTRTKGQDYNDYVENIARYNEALAVKWQDMIDNTTGDIPKKQFEKYRNAVLYLKSDGIKIPDILIKRLKV